MHKARNKRYSNLHIAYIKQKLVPVGFVKMNTCMHN